MALSPISYGLGNLQLSHMLLFYRFIMGPEKQSAKIGLIDYYLQLIRSHFLFISNRNKGLMVSIIRYNGKKTV